MILAIDPGTEQSAYVLYDGARACVVEHGIVPNTEMLRVISRLGERYECSEDDRLVGVQHCVVEMVASYGMAVGREVFETCVWVGRFIERWNSDAHGDSADTLVRRDVKMHLCGNNSAKDSNIRQALLDKFGPGKERAVGKKHAPGPLYGVKADEWAALALAVTFAETHSAAQRAA